MSTAEEVEDYMSDTFVAQDMNDIRPTLLFSHSSRVKHELLKKKSKFDPKPKTYYKDLEHRLREEAMNTPLDSTNKGFKMLAKMGFNGRTDGAVDERTGSAPTGSSSDNTKTFAEPIRVELKNDRKGLGSKPKPMKSVRKSDQIDDKVIVETFLSNKRSKNELFLLEKDLKTAQTVCRNLDLESGIDESAFLGQTVRPNWFWPKIVDPVDADDGEDTEECVESTEDMLKSINDYLRHKYFYCIWCGIQFNDCQDLNDNCFGDTRDDHK